MTKDEQQRLQKFVEQIIAIMETQIHINDEMHERVRALEKELLNKNTPPKERRILLGHSRAVQRMIEEFKNG